MGKIIIGKGKNKIKESIKPIDNKVIVEERIIEKPVYIENEKIVEKPVYIEKEKIVEKPIYIEKEKIVNKEIPVIDADYVNVKFEEHEDLHKDLEIFMLKYKDEIVKVKRNQKISIVIFGVLLSLIIVSYIV